MTHHTRNHPHWNEGSWDSIILSPPPDMSDIITDKAAITDVEELPEPKREGFLEIVGGIFSDIMEGIGSILGGAVDFVGGVFDFVVQGVSNFISWTANAIEGIFGGTTEEWYADPNHVFSPITISMERAVLPILETAQDALDEAESIRGVMEGIQVEIESKIGEQGEISGRLDALGSRIDDTVSDITDVQGEISALNDIMQEELGPGGSVADQIDDLRTEIEAKLGETGEVGQSINALRTEMQGIIDDAETSIIAELDTKTNSLQGGISALESAQTLLDTKAQQGIDDAAAIASQMPGITSSIASLQTEQSSLSSDQTALSNRIQGVEGDLPGMQDAITAAHSKGEEVQNNLNNLKFGGRNLLRNSKNLSVTGSDNGAGVKTGTPGEIEVIGEGLFNAYWFMQGHITERDRFFTDHGEEYTLSAEIRATVVGDAQYRFRFDTRSPGNGYDNSGAPFGDTGGRWIQVSYTAKIGASAEPGSQSLVNFTLFSGSTSVGDKIEYRNWKLEKGNKATEWTPAPEDIQVQFQDLSSEISDTNAKFPAINAAIATANQNYDNLSDDLDTKVAALEAADLSQSGEISAARQKADDALAALPGINSQLSGLATEQGELATGLANAATQEQYNELNSDLWGVQQDYNALNTAFQAEQTKINEVQTLVNTKQDEWNTASTNATKALQDIATEQGRINTLNSEFQTAQTAYNNLNTEFQSLQTTFNTKQLEWNDVQEEVNNNQIKWNQTSADVTAKQGEWNQAVTDLLTLQSAWNDTQTGWNAKQEAINDLNDEYQTLNDELWGEQGDINRLNYEYQSLNTELWGEQGDINLLNSENADRQSEINTINENLWGAQGELNALNEEMWDDQSTLNTKLSEFTEMQLAFNDTQTGWNAKMTEFTQLQTQFNDETTGWQRKQEEINTLQQDFDDEQIRLAEQHESVMDALALAQQSAVDTSLRMLTYRMNNGEDDYIVFNTNGTFTAKGNWIGHVAFSYSYEQDGDGDYYPGLMGFTVPDQNGGRTYGYSGNDIEVVQYFVSPGVQQVVPFSRSSAWYGTSTGWSSLFDMDVDSIGGHIVEFGATWSHTNRGTKYGLAIGVGSDTSWRSIASWTSTSFGPQFPWNSGVYSRDLMATFDVTAEEVDNNGYITMDVMSESTNSDHRRISSAWGEITYMKTQEA